MRKRPNRFGPGFFSKDRSPALTVSCLSFLIGTFIGLFFAGILPQGEGETLTRYISGYLSAVESGSVVFPDRVSSFWSTFRWLIGMFLCSFASIGILAIPILLCARGFLLSFAVSCFIRALGASGVILSALLFGLPGLFSIPALLLLGVQSFDRSLRIGQKGKTKQKKKYYFDHECRLRLAVSILLSWLSLALERGMIPPLLEAIAGTF